LLLSVPYRKQLNFTFEGLQGAESTIERLQNFRRLVKDAKTNPGSDPLIVAIVDNAVEEFEAAMNDDFNTANALAAIHNLVRDINTILARDGLCSDEQTSVLVAIGKFDSVLGIFGEEKDEMLDADIDALIEERQTARQQRNFKRSDEIRDLLGEMGIVLEDTKDGVRWKRK
jgi:cysteinyl-tRNA synthetase